MERVDFMLILKENTRNDSVDCIFYYGNIQIIVGLYVSTCIYERTFTKNYILRNSAIQMTDICHGLPILHHGKQ